MALERRPSGTGIWSAPLRYGDAGAAAEVAAEVEALGYDAIWLPDVGGDLFGAVENVLGATHSVTVASGILNLWLHEPADAATAHARLAEAHGRRFLMGIGVSHGPFINMGEAGRYRRPLTHVRDFLDGVDTSPTPVPVDERILAALGPKMLELAKQRTAGTHQYLVLPEHTAAARQALGPGPLVAPEQGVVLEADPDAARAIARQHLRAYLGLPNYTNSWKRQGFTDDDLVDGGSDRLVDALVAWGDEQAIADRVQAHHEAGADHVCIQVLTSDLSDHGLEALRRLAPALVGT